MQRQQIGIAGQNQLRSTSDGCLQKLVILWVTADAKVRRNIYEFRAANKVGQQRQPP